MIDLSKLDVLGIHGPLDGGKDTIAHYIIKTHPGFVKYAFAKPLKDAAKVIFNFTDLQLEDRKLKEEVDPYWNVSPRKVCQLLGSEFGRDMIDKNIWIKRAQLQIQKNREQGYKTIITDVRFQNEADWLRTLPNSKLLYLSVPNLNKDEKYQHQSETGFPIDDSIDQFFLNDKSKGLGWLYSELEKIIV